MANDRGSGKPPPRVTPLKEGYIVKGGKNPPTSQVTVRPPGPTPISKPTTGKK